MSVDPDGAPFSLTRYRTLLAAARDAGYRPRGFAGGDPVAGDLLLRHDVDMSLEAAVRMAELEHEEGVVATYFLMTESVFYNLSSKVGRWALGRLRELGHHVGHHGAWPTAAAAPGFGFEPVLAWHTPEPHYMALPVDGALNVMDPRFTGDFTWTYRSDSNMAWRRGDPLADLRAGRFPWLQLLVHPLLWVYPGATMRETMAAFLDDDRRIRWERLRDERIELGEG